MLTSRLWLLTFVTWLSLAACGGDKNDDDNDAVTAAQLQSKCNAFCDEVAACPGSDADTPACKALCGDIATQSGQVACESDAAKYFDCLVALDLCTDEGDSCEHFNTDYGQCFDAYCASHTGDTTNCN
jgi:hypothetical protein